MLVENEFEVAAPLEQVWKHMQDVPRGSGPHERDHEEFAKCLADDIGRSARGEAVVKREAVPVKVSASACRRR
jgi:hypothetical protein